ncbi:MarP family serine protease [Acidipropionibacterium thoenii]|uniref:MarP family serine protease n=1 Tax=Acidipropionibacterium thoenii TaxID=1751 RepID=UPI00041A368B|nr:MarP family serine protease [Acidipropionibacterium thoenii]
MTGSLVLDGFLILVLIGQAVQGYRRGAVVGVLGLAGLVLGAWAGLWFSGRMSGWLATEGISGLGSGLIRIGVLLAAAGLGQALATGIGRRLIRANRIPTLRAFDSLVGAVVGVVVTALMATVVATAVRPLVQPSWSRAIAESQVLDTTDRVIPDAVNRAAVRAVGTLVDGFPRVFSGLEVEPNIPTETPDDSVTGTAGVQRAASSIVKVRAVSRQCSQSSEGSGWVSARDRVVTNAHVVAGSNSVSVQVGGRGLARQATVVAYDPDLDLAVLEVPGLDATPLSMSSALSAGDQAVVAGFPLDGPYTLSAARVRGTIEARGDNIYSTATVTRQVMAIRATVEPGNSGGPLLTPAGTVAGTVFARSSTDSQTGYVLTNAATRAMITQAATDTTAASTQACAVS